jgi:hypothetical protein
MKKFALVGGNKVANIVAAESAATIGPLADVFIVVDITDMQNPPSVGFERRADGTFIPELPFEAKASWGVAVEEEESVPAPKASSKKKASDEETPAEE